MKSDVDVQGPKQTTANRSADPWMFCVTLSGEDFLFSEHPARLALLKHFSFFVFFSESHRKK